MKRKSVFSLLGESFLSPRGRPGVSLGDGNEACGCLVATDEVCPVLGKVSWATGKAQKRILPSLAVPVDEFICKGLCTVTFKRNILAQPSPRCQADLLMNHTPTSGLCSLVLDGMLEHSPPPSWLVIPAQERETGTVPLACLAWFQHLPS